MSYLEFTVLLYLIISYIGAVVLAPIGLVLMLPYTGVMAYCEPNNC